MKVGIITFHTAHNFGAVLQAYALQSYLLEHGHEAIILNYECPFITWRYKTFSFSRCISRNPITAIKKTIHEFKSIKLRNETKNNYQDFLTNYLKLSQSFVSKDGLPKDLDAYIFGSDQIWNGRLTGGLDDVYIGNFSTPNSRKISYAASMLASPLNANEARILSTVFKDYYRISVREYSVKEILAPLTYKPIEVVVDPTLLLERSKWLQITEEPVSEKGYVFMYKVPSAMNVRKHSEALANKHGLSLITNEERNLTPIDFLRYIRYADFVVSNSFHATVFSLIYQKQFYTMARGNGSDARFSDLLSSLGVEGRIFTDILSNSGTIHYKELDIENKLREYRKTSESFLLNSLED